MMVDASCLEMFLVITFTGVTSLIIFIYACPVILNFLKILYPTRTAPVRLQADIKPPLRQMTGNITKTLLAIG
jgi:hypothetical protein